MALKSRRASWCSSGRYRKEVHHGSAVRNLGRDWQTDALGLSVKSVFHVVVAKVVPLLHAVNTEQSVEWVGTTPITSLGIEGFNELQHP
uniref:Uncharacterized protein n=1 Tax=Aeromonas hydrophila TaxID=644 RepID=A0A346ACV3_AERHY|nr:hypothetical protein [Aeromonas hydrophila]